MVEQVFKLSLGNKKTVEKVIFDENVHYLHMVFNQEEDFRNISPIPMYT